MLLAKPENWHDFWGDYLQGAIVVISMLVIVASIFALIFWLTRNERD